MNTQLNHTYSPPHNAIEVDESDIHFDNDPNVIDLERADLRFEYQSQVLDAAQVIPTV